jgi:hypothetical protein
MSQSTPDQRVETLGVGIPGTVTTGECADDNGCSRVEMLVAEGSITVIGGHPNKGGFAHIAEEIRNHQEHAPTVGSRRGFNGRGSGDERRQ